MYRRLFEVLTGREQEPRVCPFERRYRRAILEILLATKPGLPAEWSNYEQQSSAPAFNRSKSDRKENRMKLYSSKILSLAALAAVLRRADSRRTQSLSKAAGTPRLNKTVSVIPFRLDISGDGAR